jgi:hypothetical protein
MEVQTISELYDFNFCFEKRRQLRVGFGLGRGNLGTHIEFWSGKLLENVQIGRSTTDVVDITLSWIIRSRC